MAKKKRVKRTQMSAGQRGTVDAVDKAVGGPADKIKAQRIHKRMRINASVMGGKQPAPFPVWYKEVWPKMKAGKQ